MFELLKGEFIILAVRWPIPLLNPEFLLKKWLISEDGNERIEPYHPKIVGFRTALEKPRKLVSDVVESHVRIFLPFAVQMHIEDKRNLDWRENSVRVFYMELKAAVEQYAVVKDSQEFEAV